MALKKARRRREILVTAAAVFAEFGYFNATMKDIANRIGMRSGSLYHYLESKEAALEQICRDGAAEFCGRLQTIADNGGPFAGIVEQGIRAHLTADRRDYVVSFAFNRRNLPAGVVDELNEMARAYRRIWVQIFRHGRDCGEWQSDIDPGWQPTPCFRSATASRPPWRSSAVVKWARSWIPWPRSSCTAFWVDDEASRPFRRAREIGAGLPPVARSRGRPSLRKSTLSTGSSAGPCARAVRRNRTRMTTPRKRPKGARS